MADKHNRLAVCIIGPTGVGKTAVGMHVAERLKGEIVSADSRQIFKYMNIGTDKPPAEYLARVPHHFVDIIDPSEWYNAGKFGKQARTTIDDIFDRNRAPVIVGGSGMYVKSLLEGFFDEQIKDISIKEALIREISQNGTAELYRELQRVDPEFAAGITENDAQRIARGLEVYQATGKPLSQHWKESKTEPEFVPVIFCLNRNREELYDRINRRVDQMIEEGLVKEVEEILVMGYDKSLNSLQTYGYQEVIEHLEGDLSFDEMVELIKKRSRNFAKRQLTWFRGMKKVKWINAGDDSKKTAGEVLQFYEQFRKDFQKTRFHA